MKIFKSILFLLLALFVACKEEVKPNFPAIKLNINDSNDITFSDSIYFISTDSTARRITIMPETDDVQLFYSINGRPLEKSRELSFVLYKQDTLLRFFLSKESFEDSPFKTIVFRSNSQNFLEQTTLATNLQGADTLITLSNKSRGLLTFEVFNRWGKRVIQRSHFKFSETLTIHPGLDGFLPGVYYGRLSYGKNSKSFSLVWLN